VENPGFNCRSIAIFSTLCPLKNIINWYHHTMLAHVGMTRLDAIIAADFYHPTFKA
jgi:hypothetical protein